MLRFWLRIVQMTDGRETASLCSLTSYPPGIYHPRWKSSLLAHSFTCLLIDSGQIGRGACHVEDTRYEKSLAGLFKGLPTRRWWAKCDRSDYPVGSSYWSCVLGSRRILNPVCPVVRQTVDECESAHQEVEIKLGPKITVITTLYFLNPKIQAGNCYELNRIPPL